MTSASSSSGKNCVACGADCTGKPRVKDPKGRYYCRACYDARSAQPEAVDPDILDLEAISAAATAPVVTATTKFCARCGAPALGGARHCTRCGHELASSSVSAPPSLPTLPAFKPQRQESRAEGGSGLLFQLGGGATFFIAAIILFCQYVSQFASRQGLAIDQGGPGLPVADSWSGVVIISAVAALLGGAIWYLVGPAWYALRVRWAGGDADSAEIRSPYFATIAPLLLVTVPYTLWMLMGFSNPASWWNDDDGTVDLVAGIISHAMLFAIAAWLFLVVRRPHGVKTVPGLLLLVGLPWLVYVVQAIAMVAMGAALAIQSEAQFEPSPQWSMYQGSSTVRFAFSYPSNWNLDLDPASAVWAGSCELVGPDGSSLLMSYVDNPMSTDQLIQETLDTWANDEMTIYDRESIAMLSRWSGAGKTFEVEYPDSRHLLTIFVSPLGNGHLLIESVVLEPDSYGGAAAIDRILRSLTPMGAP